jgi:hypothetical protein
MVAGQALTPVAVSPVGGDAFLAYAEVPKGPHVAPLGLLLLGPHLPSWLPDLRLQGIRVGQARVDVEVWRTPGGATRYRAVRREGSVRVLRQPPPDTPDAGLCGRAAAALRSLLHA